MENAADTSLVDQYLPDVDWDALHNLFESLGWVWDHPQHAPSAEELREKAADLLGNLVDHVGKFGPDHWISSGRLVVFCQSDKTFGLFVGERGDHHWKPHFNAPRRKPATQEDLQKYLSSLAKEPSPFDDPAFDPVKQAYEHFPDDGEDNTSALVTNYFSLGQEAGRVELARELLRAFFPFEPSNWKHEGLPRYADNPVKPEYFGTVKVQDLIDSSSLGTPEVQQACAEVEPSVVERILDKVPSACDSLKKPL